MDLPTVETLIVALNDVRASNPVLAAELGCVGISPAMIGEGEYSDKVPGMAVVLHPLWRCSCPTDVVFRAIVQCAGVEDFYEMLSEAGVAWATDEGKKSELGTVYYNP